MYPKKADLKNFAVSAEKYLGRGPFLINLQYFKSEAAAFEPIFYRVAVLKTLGKTSVVPLLGLQPTILLKKVFQIGVFL